MTSVRRRATRLARLGALWLLAAHLARADEPANADHLSFGPGDYVTSSYPGARSTRSVVIPFVDAEYAGRLYTSASDLLGVYAIQDASTQAGAAVEYDLTERLARDDRRFRRLRNIRDTPRFKLFGSETVAFVTGDMNVATDAANRGQGTLAQGNVWFTLPLIPKTLLSIGPGVTWADEQYTRTFFGISASQAAVSSLSAYVTHAGVLDRHLNGLQTVELSSRFSIGVSEYLARLHGSAVDSPVTLARSQVQVLAWLAYKLK